MMLQGDWPHPVLKVCDFGYSKDEAGQSISKSTCGACRVSTSLQCFYRLFAAALSPRPWQSACRRLLWSHNARTFHRSLRVRILTMHRRAGTPEYMAPEVLLEDKYDGKAADVWCAPFLWVPLFGFSFILLLMCSL